MTMLLEWKILYATPRGPRKRTARALTGDLYGQGASIDERSIERRPHALSRLFPLVCGDRSQPYGGTWMADTPHFDVPGMDPETPLAAEQKMERLNIGWTEITATANDTTQLWRWPLDFWGRCSGP